MAHDLRYKQKNIFCATSVAQHFISSEELRLHYGRAPRLRARSSESGNYFWCFSDRVQVAITVCDATYGIHLSVLFLFLFVCFISLMTDEPQRTINRLPIPPTATLPPPSCYCLGSRRIFPSLPGSRLYIFLSRCKVSTLTYARSRPAFRYGSQNTDYVFHENRTHDLRASRCTWLPTINRALGRRGCIVYLVHIIQYQACLPSLLCFVTAYFSPLPRHTPLVPRGGGMSGFQRKPY